jgi:hypothetical protein
MPNRKSHNTSAVPGKPRLSEEEKSASNVRRQEGTVDEHRERLNRNNQQATDAESKETKRHREPGRRR